MVRIPNASKLALVFIASGYLAHAETESWRTHSLGPSLEVQIPATWRVLESSSPERLAILSAKQGAEGVVIGPNEAEIIVAVEPASKSVDELIRQNVRDAPIVSRHSMGAADGGKAHPCASFEEVVTKEEVGPNTFVTDTGLFCQLHDSAVVLLLRYWPNDARQAIYQNIAREMMSTIRPAKGASR